MINSRYTAQNFFEHHSNSWWRLNCFAPPKCVICPFSFLLLRSFTAALTFTICILPFNTRATIDGGQGAKQVDLFLSLRKMDLHHHLVFAVINLSSQATVPSVYKQLASYHNDHHPWSPSLSHQQHGVDLWCSKNMGWVIINKYGNFCKHSAILRYLQKNRDQICPKITKRGFYWKLSSWIQSETHFSSFFAT